MKAFLLTVQGESRGYAEAYLRKLGAEIDPEGNPVCIWFKIEVEPEWECIPGYCDHIQSQDY